MSDKKSLAKNAFLLPGFISKPDSVLQARYTFLKHSIQERIQQ